MLTVFDQRYYTKTQLHSTVMLLLNEVCGRQIGSLIAYCLLLKIQQVDLALPFQMIIKSFLCKIIKEKLPSL